MAPGVRIGHHGGGSSGRGYPQNFAGTSAAGDPLRHTEPAGGCGVGEALRHVREGLAEGHRVNPGSGDGFPGDLILPGLDGLTIPHSGLDGVFQGFRLRLGLVNQGLQLAQLPRLGFQFVDTHGVFLLISCGGWFGTLRNVTGLYEAARRGFVQGQGRESVRAVTYWGMRFPVPLL